jgi:DNA polymerase III delta prime subunit
MTDPKNLLWCEKYRPQTVDECILPENIKATFNSIVKSGVVPHMMLCGTQGLGKTSAARAICKSLGYDIIVINGSDENGIDVLRNKIKNFASTVSFDGNPKVVILDEADGLTPQTQSALRNFMEEFADNCRFILTCNFKNKIIEPLHSRCAVIEFNSDKKTLAELSAAFMQRLTAILAAEGVTDVNKKILAELIMRYAPDWRRILGECQRYAHTGGIGENVLASHRDGDIHELIRLLKAKDFKNMRIWVGQNSDGDATSLFRRLYDACNDAAKPSAIPSIVLILADYSYKNAFVADREINTVACFTEIMSSAEWL